MLVRECRLLRLSDRLSVHLLSPRTVSALLHLIEVISSPDIADSTESAVVIFETITVCFAWSWLARNGDMVTA